MTSVTSNLIFDRIRLPAPATHKLYHLVISYQIIQVLKLHHAKKVLFAWFNLRIRL